MCHIVKNSMPRKKAEIVAKKKLLASAPLRHGKTKKHQTLPEEASPKTYT